MINGKAPSKEEELKRMLQGPRYYDWFYLTFS
jgi:hypothetical protein